MVEGINKFWATPFRIVQWKEFPHYAKEIISVIKQFDEEHTKEIESVEIAGLDHGLTTKWYTYNFLQAEHRSVKQLRDFVTSEVKNYLNEIGHHEEQLYLQSWANLLKNGDTLNIHSHAGPYSYVSGVFFVKTIASTTRYFLPLDRRIPGVEDFYETEIDIQNREGGLVIFPSFVEHCSTPTLDGLERMTIAFDVLKEAPKDRYHNAFGYKVIDEF
jgi:hypothetical protein